MLAFKSRGLRRVVAAVVLLVVAVVVVVVVVVSAGFLISSWLAFTSVEEKSSKDEADVVGLV